MVYIAPRFFAFLALCAGVVLAMPQHVTKSVGTKGVATKSVATKSVATPLHPPSSTAAQPQSTAPALSKSYLESLPIKVSTGGANPVVYAGNSSLIQAKPNIQPAVNQNLTLLNQIPANVTDKNLATRDECEEGVLTGPMTYWSNIALLIEPVCDAWFPGSQTYWLPGGSFGTSTVVLGPGYPDIYYLYETVNLPCSNCAASMTSIICQSIMLGELNYAHYSGTFTCALWPDVNEVDDFDDASAGVHFLIEVI